MHANVLSNLSFRMWKVEHKVYVLIFVPKIVALNFFGSNNVMVPNVNKFGFVANTPTSSSMTPSIKL